MTSMPENSTHLTCTKCNAVVTGSFCSECGHPVQLERINLDYMIRQIIGIVNFDRGILLTLRELLLRPGKSVHIFIHKNRSLFVKPIVFIIVCSLAYSITQEWFRFEDEYVSYNFEDTNKTTVQLIFEWITNNYGYANIIMAGFIAVWIKLFFRKYNYNIFEITILLCYIMGVSMLMLAILGALESISGYKTLGLGSVFSLGYITWAIGQFYDQKKVSSYIKSFLSYLLGMITCFFVMILIGLTFDFLFK